MLIVAHDTRRAKRTYHEMARKKHVADTEGIGVGFYR